MPILYMINKAWIHIYFLNFEYPIQITGQKSSSQLIGIQLNIMIRTAAKTRHICNIIKCSRSMSPKLLVVLPNLYNEQERKYGQLNILFRHPIQAPWTSTTGANLEVIATYKHTKQEKCSTECWILVWFWLYNLLVVHRNDTCFQ